MRDDYYSITLSHYYTLYSLLKNNNNNSENHIVSITKSYAEEYVKNTQYFNVEYIYIML